MEKNSATAQSRNPDLLQCWSLGEQLLDLGRYCTAGENHRSDDYFRLCCFFVQPAHALNSLPNLFLANRGAVAPDAQLGAGDLRRADASR
jgi:hypothetical protein